MNHEQAKTLCQELIDLYVSQGDLQPVKLQVKDNYHGRASYNTRILVIPLWLFGLSKKGYTKRNLTLAYRYYYILHEISHFINWDSNRNTVGHGKLFKSIERRLLKDLGLVPVYNRAYVKQLLSSNGKTVYRKG